MNNVPLAELMPSRVPSLNPANFPDEEFELWSIPAFDSGKPETLNGSEIGSTKKCVEPDDVLLSRIVPHIRRSWVVDQKKDYRKIASGEWIIFRSARFFPAYLRHVLISNDFHARFMQTVAGVGGSLLRARPEGVKEIEIPLPPLEEQKRIAAILDQADSLRRLRQRAIDRLSSLLQSIFITLFGDPITNPQCPVATLGDHLSFVTSGGRGWAKYYSEKGSVFIRSLDVQMNSISHDDVVFVKPPDNAEARRTRIAKNDVLLTITGSRIGRVARAPGAIDGGYVSQHVAILRLSGSLLPDFVARFLSLQGGGQLQIAKMQYGQTKPGLNFEQIRAFKVPIPSVLEQRRFTMIVKAVERQETRLRAQIAVLERLFSSLQHRAFRGEL